MVRFSCFQAHINSNKQKKSGQSSAEEMQKTLQDYPRNQTQKDIGHANVLNPASTYFEGNIVDNHADNHTDFSPDERDCKSEEMRTSKYETGSDIVSMKKTRSLGSGLDHKGRGSVGNDSEDETDQRFSCNGSPNNSNVLAPDDARNSDNSLRNHFQEAVPSDSLRVNSDAINNESIFSIGDQQQSVKDGHGDFDVQLSVAGESDARTPRTPIIVKSNSMPNMSSPCRAQKHSISRSRSAEDLSILVSRRNETYTDEVGEHDRHCDGGHDGSLNNQQNIAEVPPEENGDTYNYVRSAKDWIIPAMDESPTKRTFQGESSFCRWDELPSKDFRLKRIEEWVMDLQHCNPVEEMDEICDGNDHEVPKNSSTLDVSPTARMEGIANPGTEAAKKYISLLSATSTAAHLANLGVVVIPFLSAFGSLRAINLSGNAIVRISAGALPRGLHILNLSKNNISNIEGLRELTRLRVLDLSYNRILRIGHGLASCSSLKELYLAGNKISEVEGLHRLLKLNVLDLRFNKISTTKCLGQLAANYNSLHAISLEGNPAQKNVGDEQLKKYLLGLLPHLMYLNRHSIKVGALKDTTDRSARLAISGHQMERGLRSDLKTTRKANHAIIAGKVTASSTHGRKSPAIASPKPTRSRHGRLPPSGTKTTTQRHQVYDFSSNLLGFRPDLSMRRVRSEGTIGAL